MYFCRCQRKGLYDQVEMWVMAAKRFEPTGQYRATMNVFSQLQLLEVELLELARCKQRKKKDRIINVNTVVQKVHQPTNGYISDIIRLYYCLQ